METSQSRKKLFSKNHNSSKNSLKNIDLKSQLDHERNNYFGANSKSNSDNLAQRIKNLLKPIRKFFGFSSETYLLAALNKAVDNCQAASAITTEEKKMIQNIIKIGDVRVIDIAIPRTDIIAIKKDAPLEEIKELIKTKEHTRIPVYGENLDEIIGFVHSKDLVKFEKNKNLTIADLIRKIIYVPNSMRIIDLLLKMRSSRIHIAIVLDEYGGTDGLVTIENIVEEIIGDIEDEHDSPDNNIYLHSKKINDHIFHFGGRVEIEKVEELIGEKIIANAEEADFETIGGLMLAALKKVPEAGEIVRYSKNLSFKVLEADMRSVKLVEITKLQTSDDEVSGQ